MNEYSLNKIIKDLVSIQADNVNLIDTLAQAMSSNNNTVELKLLNRGNPVSVTIPSFGNIQNQLSILDKNIKNLAGIVEVSGRSTTTIQTSDGETRKVLTAELKREANTIQSLNKPNTFNKKENWFFESFLNPMLHVSFDLSGQLKDYTKEVEVSRYILNIDSLSKTSTYNTLLDGRDDVEFNEFFKILNDNLIEFSLDKSVVAVPPKALKYSGEFIVKEFKSEFYSPDGSASLNVLNIKLDKLTYKESGIENKTLKKGNKLLINNTVYQIQDVIDSEVAVRVTVLEGLNLIAIGSTATLYSQERTGLTVDINIGFNERCVIFIKGIDPDSKILSTDYSPGVAFFSNDLTIEENGNTIKLDKYYQEKVSDFSTFLISSLKEKTVPAILGLQPDPPTLTASNFKVEQINKHLDTVYYKSILSRQNDKPRLQSSIQELDKSISDLRLKITSTQYTNEQTRNIDDNKLKTLINQRESFSNSYKSIVDSIDADISRIDIDKLSPKYRIRGFYPFPNPKKSDKTRDQHVVQFIVQYRYVGKNGSPNNPVLINYTGSDGKQQNGVYSPWAEYKTNVRKKLYNNITREFYWESELTDNADIVNINQLDIPINPGESVEFRIKSISEAGWPNTTLESNWSEIIKIDFPGELEANVNKDIINISEQNKLDKLKNDLLSDFQSMNLDKLAGLTFTQNSNFYAGDSKHIASGFTTQEKNVINLFDKLLEMDNLIKDLKAQIQTTRGVLAVSIIDESGNEYKVEKNQTIKLFAGNYKDEIEDLGGIKKGAIVTKTYLLKLNNSTAGNLELYSKYWGPKNLRVDNSRAVEGSSDYNSVREYHLAPIGLSNVETDNIVSFLLPKQSAQVCSQFIYNRNIKFDGTELYKKWGAVALDNDYYTTASNLIQIEDVEGSGPSNPSNPNFVWNFLYDESGIYTIPIDEVDNLYKNILLHEDHPNIPLIVNQMGSTGATGKANILIQSGIRNSKSATLNTKNSNYCQHSAFNGNLLDASSKLGFVPEDQYLIGASSVGAYLFMKPGSYDDITTDGVFFNSDKIVKFGATNSLTIPIIFQYRMTDYYGKGSEGTGNINGVLDNRDTSLVYTKCLGFDIYTNKIEGDIFSFDLEVTARYKTELGANTNIPSISFTNAIDDLTSSLRS